MRESVGLYALSLGLGTLLSLALAAYGWRRRRLVPGGDAFAVFNLGVALWTGVYILGVDATGSAALFWANMAFLGKPFGLDGFLRKVRELLDSH